MNVSFSLFGHIIKIEKDPNTINIVKPLSKRGKKIARDFEYLSKIGRVKALRELSEIGKWYPSGQWMRLMEAKEWVEEAYHDYGSGPAK